MKKEWFLLLTSTAITLLVAVGLIRWLAPGLLGISTDLQLVQVDDKMPPFYEGIFRQEDLQSQEFILKDPYTRVRAHPLFPEVGSLGPHDLLGFRNRRIPNIADIVVIGDSQTYGNNASIDENYPHQLEILLANKLSLTYSMAVGGWGAVQYLDMFMNAMAFQPRAIVVAFYSGNDPLESFQLAYGVDHWKSLIPNPNLSASDIPKVEFPPPKSQWWPVEFKDGIKTVFTPTLRLASNQNHPAVQAGYQIMANAAAMMSKVAEPYPIKLIFTVIPTKELVYAQKVQQEKLVPPEDYLLLTTLEQQNITQLATQIQSLPNADFVDLVTPLQQAALTSVLYPADTDGHPVSQGYKVIANILAQNLQDKLPTKPQGVVAIQSENNQHQIALVHDLDKWYFKDESVFLGNGWRMEGIPLVRPRDLAGHRFNGVIDSVNPTKYGPSLK